MEIHSYKDLTVWQKGMDIAEGKMRGTRKDYRHFLLDAYGSRAELGTQILIAKRLSLSSELAYSKVDGLLEEIMKMLTILIHKLTTSPITYHL